MYVHVDIRTGDKAAETLATVALPEYRAKVERALVFHLEAFDWNCPQHITPRFTEAELTKVFAPARQHMAQLEAENAQLREKLQQRSQS